MVSLDKVIIIISKRAMQKRKYEHFEEERETEMRGFDDNIPVGHPVANYPQSFYPYPQNNQQYPYLHDHPQPPFQAPPPPPPPIMVQRQPPVKYFLTYSA